MVHFRQTLIEKDERVTVLSNLTYADLKRIMANGGWNVINLTKDRTLFFDKDNPGRFNDFDLQILHDKNEVFDQCILLKWNNSQIEASIARKIHLAEQVFIEVKISNLTKQTTASVPAIDDQPVKIENQPISQLSTKIATNSNPRRNVTLSVYGR